LAISLRVDKPIEEAIKPSLDESFEAERFVKKKKLKLQPAEADIASLICEEIKDIFDDVGVIVDSVQFEKKKGYYIISSNSTYCPNRQGHHSTSTQWYRLTKQHLERHCRCPKDVTEGRLWRKKCSEWIERYDIPQRFLDAFFDGKKPRVFEPKTKPRSMVKESKEVSDLRQNEKFDSYFVECHTKHPEKEKEKSTKKTNRKRKRDEVNEE
jgi:hypothetical protein